jgi:hypothetical protein
MNGIPQPCAGCTHDLSNHQSLPMEEQFALMEQDRNTPLSNECLVLDCSCEVWQAMPLPVGTYIPLVTTDGMEILRYDEGGVERQCWDALHLREDRTILPQEPRYAVRVFTGTDDSEQEHVETINEFIIEGGYDDDPDAEDLWVDDVPDFAPITVCSYCVHGAITMISHHDDIRRAGEDL